MKKFALLFIVAILCAASVFALTACNKDDDYSLRFDEKYLYSRYSTRSTSTGSTEKVEEYYIFRKDGTGIYGYSSIQTETNIYINHESQFFDEYKYGYTISFKYTYLDGDKSTVMAFYDGVVYNDDNTVSAEILDNDYSHWRIMILVSANACIESGTNGQYFIREGYLDDVPNYENQYNYVY